MRSAVVAAFFVSAACAALSAGTAADFINAAHSGYVGAAAAYYIDTRPRSSPDEQQKYCRPLRA